MASVLSSPRATASPNCPPMTPTWGHWTIWFPRYERLLQYLVPQCVIWLQANQTAFAPPGGFNWQGCSTCADLISCVYSSLPESIKLNCASAQVLLGVTPTLLSGLAPSPGEIAMLSSARPMLSMLLSISTPAIFVWRYASFDDPVDYLRQHRGGVGLLGRGGALNAFKKAAPLVALLQYLFALAAVANTVEVTMRLANRTIVAWKCENAALAFSWAATPLLIHLLAALSWRWSRTMLNLRQEGEQRARDNVREQLEAASASARPQPFRYKCAASLLRTAKQLWTALKSRVASETTLCALRQRRGYFRHHCRSERLGVVFCGFAASCFSYFLLIFSTFTLSNLLFIGSSDSVVVVGRYIASTASCRLLLMFELDCLAELEAETGRDEGEAQ